MSQWLAEAFSASIPLFGTYGTGTDAMISRYTAEIGTATLTAGLGLAAVVGALEFGIGWGDAGPEPGAFPFYIGLLVIAASVRNA